MACSTAFQTFTVHAGLVADAARIDHQLILRYQVANSVIDPDAVGTCCEIPLTPANTGSGYDLSAAE
jgi:hypothetical protein